MNASSRLLLPLLLLAGAVPAAEVGTSVTQGALSTTRINFFMTNNDIGAIYNSAELRLEAALGAVFTAIRSRNPAAAAMTTADLISTGHLSGSIQPGEVSGGWTQSISPSTSIVAFGHVPFYTTWQNTASNAAQDTMVFTLNLGKNSATDPRLKNFLDFDGDGQLDDAERLLTLPALTAAPAEGDAGFVGMEGITRYPAAVNRFAVAGEWAVRGAAGSALGVQRSGADAVLTWQALHGLAYTLETSPTLSANPADWTPLSTQQRPPTPGTRPADPHPQRSLRHQREILPLANHGAVSTANLWTAAACCRFRQASLLAVERRRAHRNPPPLPREREPHGFLDLPETPAAAGLPWKSGSRLPQSMCGAGVHHGLSTGITDLPNRR